MKLAARGHNEVLTRDECLAHLDKVSVGRLGVTIRALPAILPVNFRLHDGQVVLRSVTGSKLDAATAGSVVAFEADDHDPDGAWGWSVLVQGVAHEVTDPGEIAVLRTLRITPWAFPDGQADRYLRIDTELVSGRRFHRSEAFRA